MFLGISFIRNFCSSRFITKNFKYIAARIIQSSKYCRIYQRDLVLDLQILQYRFTLQKFQVKQER